MIVPIKLYDTETEYSLHNHLVATKIEREKYKRYLHMSLMGAYILATILYFALIDVYKLDKAYKKSQEDLATLTIQTLEYKMILAENEELLRIRADLQKVLP